MVKDSAYRNDLSRRALKAFAIMLPLIVIAFQRILPPLPSSPMLRDAFWVGKLDITANNDVVFIGDSRVYRGIDAFYFEKLTKARSKNYGFSSACPDSLLIEHAISSLDGNGHKMAVIAVSGNSFMSGSLNNDHLKSVQAWSNSDKWLKAHVYPTFHFFDNRSVSDVFKYYKGEAYYESYSIQYGFAASNKVPMDSGSALGAYKRQFELESYSREAEIRFKRYVYELKSRGYHPVIIRVPCAAAMIRLEDEATANAIPALMEEMASGGIVVLPYYPAGLSSYDGSHLDARSAELYTDWLANALMPILNWKDE